MKLEFSPDERTLRALPVQLTDVSDAVIVKRGCTEVKIGGQGAREVVELVLAAAAEGSTREAILDHFPAPYRQGVQDLIDQLAARRIIVADDGAMQEPSLPEGSLDIFYWNFGLEAQAVAERLNTSHVAIIGVNYISRQLAASLAASGAQNVEVVNYPLLSNLRLLNGSGTVDEGNWPSSLSAPVAYEEWKGRTGAAIDCLVATSDFGGLHLMRQWNEMCVERNWHFLPVVLQDLIGYVGPLVIPGETPCFECVRARENSHITDPEVSRASESTAFEGQGVIGFHPSMASVLGDMAAIELTKFYGGWMRPGFAGTLIEVNLIATEMITHKVLRIPRCIVCGSSRTRSPINLDKVVSLNGVSAGTRDLVDSPAMWEAPAPPW